MNDVKIILLVEDECYICEVVVIVLEFEEFVVCEVGMVCYVVVEVVVWCFDLIIFDLGLFDCDGLDFICDFWVWLLIFILVFFVWI